MASIVKKLMMKEVKDTLEGHDVFFTNFDKVTVEKMSALRKSLRKDDAHGVVVKNTIARLILKDLGMEAAQDAIEGSVFLVSALCDPQKISKELVGFAKTEESFCIKGVYLDGTFHSSQYVASLAALPSREQLLAFVVGGIKAPITNFVFCLHGVLKSLVVVLAKVSKKKSESQ